MKFLAVAVLVLASWAAAQVPAAPKTTQKPAKAEPTQADLDAVPRISVAELQKMLQSDKDNLVLIDARSEAAWNSGSTMMPGAVRVPPLDVRRHLKELKKYKNRQVVAYCT